jgi:5'-3' exonuclease
LEIAKKKLTSIPGQFCFSSDPVERAKAEENDLPIVWAAERVLVKQIEGEWHLQSNYKEAYQRVGLWGTSSKHVSVKYLEALAWCFAYYKGVKVDPDWYYPWWVAPLLESVEVPDHIIIPTTERPPLTPTDQLAMVLPLSSYSLLPASYQTFPKDHPEFFPLKWSMISLGRRFLWECEPMIPLVLPSTIRVWHRTSS